jgi:hypothetical protein
MWVGGTTTVGLSLGGPGFDWPVMTIIGAHLFSSLGLVFAPMLFLKDRNWTEGRLLGGLVGAAIASIFIWMTLPNVVSTI